MVDIALQSTFRLEMHQNNIFFNLFFTSVHQTQSKNTQNNNNKLKQKNSIVF